MEVLGESFSNNAVSVHENSELFEHRVNVGVHFSFTAFIHNDEGTAFRLNVLTHLLQLFSGEGHSGATEEHKVCLSHALVIELFLVDFALETKGLDSNYGLLLCTGFSASERFSCSLGSGSGFLSCLYRKESKIVGQRRLFKLH